MTLDTTQLQTLLNARFSAKLRVDGKLGDRTILAALGNLLAETEFLRREAVSLHERLEDLTNSQDNLIEGPKPSP